MARHLQFGRAAERAACRFLQQRGLRLLTANYRCRYGELDLIMRDGPVLVVVEVRARRRNSFMDAAESITKLKRRRILRATQAFLQHNDPLQGHPVRFDVVSMTGPPAAMSIRWIRDAFTD